MSFYSKEYIECRNALEEAKGADDIISAVDKLDKKWNFDNSIMNDKDWPKLVNNVIEASQRLGLRE